jgi:ribosome-binding factor A
VFERALRGESADASGRRFDPRRDRKTLQLCRQVQRALMLALAGDCGDEVLRELYVAAVEPMGGAGQLLAHVVLPRRGDVASVVDVMTRLDARAGLLRAEVARAINRKRVPTLTFIVVADEGADSSRGEGDGNERV